MKALILSCFLLFTVKADPFEDYVVSALFSTAAIQEIHPSLLDPKIIPGLGSWELLALFETLHSDSPYIRQQCLLVKWPLGEKGGEIKMVENQFSRDCLEYIYDSSGQVKSGLSKITAKFWPAKGTGLHGLELFLEKNGQKDKPLKIPMPNLSPNALLSLKKKIGLVHYERKIVQTSATLGQFRGVQVRAIFDRRKSHFPFSQKKTLFLEKPGVAPPKLKVCQRLDFYCHSEGEQDCEKCEWGVTEIPGSACPSGSTKVCGLYACGRKNAPACSRGKIHGSKTLSLGCHSKTSEAFCQEGLILECFEGMLFCR